ncbi:MAG: hypothetical protein ACRD0V_20155, partial [Acidimicrobiales bacterium]
MDSVRNAAPDIWSLDDPSASPALLECEHCGARLHLTRDLAKGVGHERRIVVPVSTPDYVRVAVAGRDFPAQDDGPYGPAADGSVRRWTFARGLDILTPSMITTVAVGVDGSATAAEAVKMAAEVARRFEAELV